MKLGVFQPITVYPLYETATSAHWGQTPREALAELAARRNPIYALAPIHVRSEPLPHDATVDAILKALSA